MLTEAILRDEVIYSGSSERNGLRTDRHHRDQQQAVMGFGAGVFSVNQVFSSTKQEETVKRQTKVVIACFVFMIS